MSATIEPVAGERAHQRDDAAQQAATVSSTLAFLHVAVDPENPWLGLASFTEETRGYFHGREEEALELCRRVKRKLLTILFGQSGLGKTSILQAGVVPRLGPEGYCPVYVRIDYSPDSPEPAEQIKQEIFRATLASGRWTQAGSAVAGESLWEFLHHRGDVLRDASGRTLTPLLIFDQFEEIFTLAQDDDFGRERAARFVEDLADLVENRPPKALEARIEGDDAILEKFDFARADYRVLISLREDYLAHLEGLKGAMPSITQNRMRLARMTGEQALAAVAKPGGALVSEEVAESIVRFVAGGSELRNAEVEPSLLSLICRELNNARLAKNESEISTALLAGSHDTILKEFYKRALADQPAAVRRFIEDEMLTESGFRESLAEERLLKAFAHAGAAPGTLATLVNRRLLRIEERLDLRRVELTHDVLCGVVGESRDLRHEREARDQAERELKAQRERELATRKALVRARQVAAGCAVLAIGAIAGAVFGYQNMKRAQEAEAQALKTRAMAESARGESEKLIVFLLDDFQRELEPVGRLDIVADLSKRALDYYAALPPELRTEGTERNRALALVRYGHALRYQARLDESAVALSDAIERLEKLRAQGDRSEVTTIGLGLGLTAKARLQDLQERSTSNKFATQAVEVLQPLMTASPSIPAMRAQGAALLYLGFTQMRSDQSAEAIKALNAARDTFRRIDGLKEDAAAAVAYAEASAWLTETLWRADRASEARRSGEEAIAIASQVLKKHPAHMPALRARALSHDAIGLMDADSMQIGKGIQSLDLGIEDWRSFLKLDASNMVSWNNVLNVHLLSSRYLYRAGRIDESRARARAGLDLKPGAEWTPYLALNQAFWLAADLAQIEADSGRPEQMQAWLEERRRLAAIGAKVLGDTLWGLAPSYWMDIFDSQRFENAGDFAAARRAAQAGLDRYLPYKAKSDGERNFHRRFLSWGHSALAGAHIALGSYDLAEKEARKAVELWRQVPNQSLTDKRWGARHETVLAVSVARLGRDAEAREITARLLRFHRELNSRAHDDVFQKVELSHALFAAALASPPQRAALLAEAGATVDRLPDHVRRLKSVTRVRNQIAEEAAKR
jgi:conflict system STAND superfamily ATPase